MEFGATSAVSVFSVRELKDILGRKVKDSFIRISERTRTGKLFWQLREREAIGNKSCKKRKNGFWKATTGRWKRLGLQRY